eukprot:scaffold1572_cov238-Chaetoceros_neogracile.AAC.3
MDETIAATGDNSRPFTAAFDHLVVGTFNDEFGVRDREHVLAELGVSFIKRASFHAMRKKDQWKRK